MTCEQLREQVKIKTTVRRTNGIKYFDEDKFISNLICATDDGKNFICWHAETYIDRIIRELDAYAVGV